MTISPERRASLTAKANEYAANIHQAVPYLLARGISEQVASMFSIGFVPYGQGEFGGRVSIPYTTPAGVVAIKYRSVDGAQQPKYLNESGLGVRLYNAQALIRAEHRVVVTEGEFDAICVQAYCGIPAVAYPGADTWSKFPHWRHCFEGIPEVIVVADGDEAGQKAAARVAESIGWSARVVRMPEVPDEKDANLYIVKHGAEAFQHKLNS